MSTYRVLDANGSWRPINSIMPTPPKATDLRGTTTTFHGRYRGPHNTGVPDMSALSTPVFSGVLTTPNVTYNDVHFIGGIEVRATGITFNRCYFEARGENFLFNAFEATTATDCSFNGGKAITTLVVVTGSVHAIRCHIWGGGADSVGFGEGAIYDDCYIHGNLPHFGTHSDSAQTLGGSNNLFVRRCKLLAYDPASGSANGFNSAMELGVISGGTMDGLTIIDNYLDGGGYAMNASLNITGITNVYIDNNRWGRHASFGAQSGASTIQPGHGTFTSKNVYDDTGAGV